jgi:hypothetical protein
MLCGLIAAGGVLGAVVEHGTARDAERSEAKLEEFIRILVQHVHDSDRAAAPHATTAAPTRPAPWREVLLKETQTNPELDRRLDLRLRAVR